MCKVSSERKQLVSILGSTKSPSHKQAASEGEKGNTESKSKERERDKEQHWLPHTHSPMPD